MNPSTALATVLVDELARQGVHEAVLCPGSRSAPLAYALQQADRAGRIRLHVRVDERSAGFLALGLAKLTRRPVAVVTTSGSAVANLHPAVLEAHHGAVPLVVVSADRPPELRGTGANQTTDQPVLFGRSLRWCHDLGAPARGTGQNPVWRSAVSRACAAATGALGATAGPVHLNVPLREPLVPGLDAGAPWPDSLEGREGGEPWVRTVPASGELGTTPAAVGSTPGSVGSTAASVGTTPSTIGSSPLEGAPRTLVLLGDLPDPALAAAVADLAGATGWPVVAEPFGTYDRSCVVPHGALLLTASTWLEAHLPDRVLVVGRITLSRAVAAVLRRPGLTVEVVATRPDWPDPAHVVSRVHGWDALTTGVDGLAVDETWARDWGDAGKRIAEAVDAFADDSWSTGPSGLAVASTVLRGMPAGAVLFVGSSNPVRDVDLALSPNDVDPATTVVASRGLAGIDGCVSTAIGIALSQPDRPAYALMGDLTFLHDSNGLLIGPREPRPSLTIVVPNDDGGGIFTLLEPGEPGRADDFERVFGTPTGASIADLCRAHGVEYVRATTQAELARALSFPPEGITVVEVPMPRGGHRDLHARLRQVAAAALT